MPLVLLPRAQEHPAQHERTAPPRMRLGVRQTQRGPPRPAEHGVPFPHAERVAQDLDVGDQGGGGVVAQLAGGGGAACAALVDEDDAEEGGVEEDGVGFLAACAGAAVEEEDWWE